MCRSPWRGCNHGGERWLEDMHHHLHLDSSTVCYVWYCGVDLARAGAAEDLTRRVSSAFARCSSMLHQAPDGRNRRHALPASVHPPTGRAAMASSSTRALLDSHGRAGGRTQSCTLRFSQAVKISSAAGGPVCWRNAFDACRGLLGDPCPCGPLVQEAAPAHAHLPSATPATPTHRLTVLPDSPLLSQTDTCRLAQRRTAHSSVRAAKTQGPDFPSLAPAAFSTAWGNAARPAPYPTLRLDRSAPDSRSCPATLAVAPTPTPTPTPTPATTPHFQGSHFTCTTYRSCSPPPTFSRPRQYSLQPSGPCSATAVLFAPASRLPTSSTSQRTSA